MSGLIGLCEFYSNMNTRLLKIFVIISYHLPSYTYLIQKW